MFTPPLVLLTVYLIHINEDKQNQALDFTAVYKYSPNVAPSVWLAPHKWTVHLIVNKLQRDLISAAEIQRWVSGACYLCSSNSSPFSLCPVCPYAILPGVSGVSILSMFPSPSAQLSLFTKRAEHKAQYEAVYSFKRWARKSEPTAQWMPLSMVCILRGTKGINKSVLCVLPCCELPFNAFPRAALEIHYRGPEIENSILSRPSAHVLFPLARESQRGRVKQPQPLKFTEERGSPRGSQERYSLRAISCNSSVV